jgi:uncharacterized membrane protein YfcA
VIILMNAAANLTLFPLARHSAHLRRVMPLIVAGVVTVPFGIMLLLYLDASAVELVAGCATILLALALMAGFERPLGREALGFAVAGVISGVLNGLISTGGPPAILLLTNQGVRKRALRANVLAYFLFLSLASVPMFFVGGLLSATVARTALILTPAMFLGAYVGSKLLCRLPEHHFRIIALVVVMTAGIVTVLSSQGIL